MLQKFIWSLALLCLSIGCDTSTNNNHTPLTNDNKTIDYQYTFFEGTAHEVEALLYEVRLDTAQLVLINGKKKTTLKGILDTSKIGYQMLTNAGMFHANGEAVGLFINHQGQQQPLNKTQDSRGNFFLVPNGVFCVDNANKAYVLETTQFIHKMQYQMSSLQLATQSGPMLLIDGKHHPKFNQNSTNTNIRNGVGITPDQTLVFVCTTQPTNLYTFASVFKERGCQNALYLDGFISSMYLHKQAQQMNKYKQQLYGPILGVLAQ